MKSFFKSFVKSAQEVKNVRCLCVTGLFIAVSMVLEFFSIDLSFAKINFAFLAIAVIGMLYGPTVGFFAGLACDVVGYIVHPTGAFLPVYTLVAGLQGLIYGCCLYVKNDSHSLIVKNNLSGGETDITLYFRAVIARLLDVLVINLLINTRLNMHYGFIPDEAYGTAIVSRLAKNVIELTADIPLLFILLPAALMAYNRVFRQKSSPVHS
ncbi:MAG: folate family ECF transporter S component [Ruminococcus sp.]|nr:folate family ECF transporter S component [Ruminococcus sp.]